MRIRIRVRPGRVIDADRFLAFLKVNFAHRYAHAGASPDGDVDFLAAANRAGRDADFSTGGDVCHVSSLQMFGEGLRVSAKTALPPSAGLNRIRFCGSCSATCTSQPLAGSPGMRR